MSVLQIVSVSPPLDRPGVGLLAVRLLSVAEAMGLLPADEPIDRLDYSTLEAAVRRISAAAGIGRDAVAQMRAAKDRPERIEPLLRGLYQALERSPAPATEWRALAGLFGLDLLARVLGISISSLRRYASGGRRTPDAIADRLHFLALVVADLAGSLNEFGVRRWFERPRSQLDGKSPAQVLRGGWTADAPGPIRVRELARALTAPLGT